MHQGRIKKNKIFFMKLPALILPLFILLVAKSTNAQTFEGVWKGTSLCQVKNSPCHDEIVVYHISKDSTGKSYEVIANKIVNGKEEYMGTLSFTYDDQQKIFVSVDSASNARWEFKLTGNIIKGTLMYKGDLYRLINVKKEN
jgi:stress response protein SCP2